MAQAARAEKVMELDEILMAIWILSQSAIFPGLHAGGGSRGNRRLDSNLNSLFHPKHFYIFYSFPEIGGTDGK